MLKKIGFFFLLVLFACIFVTPNTFAGGGGNNKQVMSSLIFTCTGWTKECVKQAFSLHHKWTVSCKRNACKKNGKCTVVCKFSLPSKVAETKKTAPLKKYGVACSKSQECLDGTYCRPKHSEAKQRSCRYHRNTRGQNQFCTPGFGECKVGHICTFDTSRNVCKKKLTVGMSEYCVASWLSCQSGLYCHSRLGRCLKKHVRGVVCELRESQQCGKGLKCQYHGGEPLDHVSVCLPQPAVKKKKSVAIRDGQKNLIH